MILTIYLVMLGLSFMLILIGFIFEGLIPKILGFGFLFIISSSVLVDGIDYHSGDLINKTSSTITEVTMNYNNYQMPRLISIMLCALGIFGAMWVWYDDRKLRKENI